MAMQSLEEVLKISPKKYLIFDFDETIFYLDLPWHIYYEEMANRLRALDPSLPESKGINSLENLAVKKLGDPAIKVRKEYSLEFESQNLKGVEELTDLTPFIRENADKYEFYLWTSNMRETVVPVLKEYGMDVIFKKLVTKGDVRFTKPYPDGFDLMFDPKTQDKKDWLMIGNSFNDKGAAEQAGIEYWMRP